MIGAHNAIHGGLLDGRMIWDCNLHDGWIIMKLHYLSSRSRCSALHFASTNRRYSSIHPSTNPEALAAVSRGVFVARCGFVAVQRRLVPSLPSRRRARTTTRNLQERAFCFRPQFGLVLILLLQNGVGICESFFSHLVERNIF